VSTASCGAARARPAEHPIPATKIMTARNRDSRHFHGALCLRMPRPLPWAVDLQNFNKRFPQEWGRIPKTTEPRKANPRMDRNGTQLKTANSRAKWQMIQAAVRFQKNARFCLQ